MATKSSDLTNGLNRLKTELTTIPEETPVPNRQNNKKKPSPLQNTFLPGQSTTRHPPENDATPPPGILAKSPIRKKS